MQTMDWLHDALRPWILAQYGQGRRMRRVICHRQMANESPESPIADFSIEH
jgi:hypothetical protein